MPDPVLVPKLLYGTLEVAGKGWRAVMNQVWKKGWQTALENIEWIDLWRSPGPIVYESRPGGILLRDHFLQQPYFAAYLGPDTLRKLAWRETERSTACNRHMELHLEAIHWPWYLFGTAYPHNSGFMFDEGTPEEKSTARAALRAAMPHFLTIRQFEHRTSADGTFGTQQLMRSLAEHNDGPGPKGSWWTDGWGWNGIYGGHLLRAGLTKDQFMQIFQLPSLQAYVEILDWMKSEQI